MSLEDVHTTKAFLSWTGRAWAEFAQHCAFVVRQRMPVPIFSTSETFRVVFTGLNRTLLRPLVLVRDHMRTEVFANVLSASGNRTRTEA